jgi:hypothetical protein
MSTLNCSSFLLSLIEPLEFIIFVLFVISGFIISICNSDCQLRVDCDICQYIQCVMRSFKQTKEECSAPSYRQSGSLKLISSTNQGVIPLAVNLAEENSNVKCLHFPKEFCWKLHQATSYWWRRSMGRYRVSWNMLGVTLFCRGAFL